MTVPEHLGNILVTCRGNSGAHSDLRGGGGRQMGVDDDPGPVIGQTGARFSGAGRRRGRRAAAEDIPIAAPDERAHPEVSPDAPVVGMTGARFGGPSRRRRSGPPPEVGPAREVAPTPAPSRPAPAPHPPPRSVVPDPEERDPTLSSFVRPYVLTSGRTRAPFELAVEALVSAVPAASLESGLHRDILDLCRMPRSVAEIAALRGVPLGVARVLLGDLAAAGAVRVHRTAGAAGPDLALLQRVLSGLRRL